MRTLAKLAALAALLAPAAASAQLTLGARVGYAFPSGKLDDAASAVAPDRDLGEWLSYQAPVQVEASYRWSTGLSLGGYFSAALAGVGDQADAALCGAPGVDCSGRVLRAGVQLAFAFSAVPAYAPWIAVGAGYEWASLTAEGDAGETTFAAEGWELLNLQAGLDFTIAPRFAIGPFVQYALGRYTESEIELDDGTTLGGGIDEQARHGWLQLGLRGRFDL
jgi:hypothetical protein